MMWRGRRVFQQTKMDVSIFAGQSVLGYVLKKHLKNTLDSKQKMNVHSWLVKTLEAGLEDRVKQGLDAQKLTQMQLSCLSGVGQGNLSAILKGKPASEATWQKLFDVAWQ